MELLDPNMLNKEKEMPVAKIIEIIKSETLKSMVLAEISTRKKIDTHLLLDMNKDHQ
jgi:hypothetical protein